MFLLQKWTEMDLGEVAEELHRGLSRCSLCKFHCGTNRLAGERGKCGAGDRMIVSQICVHKGEEPVLTGEYGVGNVFLSGCNLSCVYCQNWQISQRGDGKVMNAREMSEELLRLQDLGCPTLGFVTPTHYAPQIVKAIALARERGLEKPLIYNTNAYDSVELLEMIEGVFQIYLPDFKYWREASAVKYSSAKGYPDAARSALKEMFRQVGNLEIDAAGVAKKGLLVRHLVLPNDLAGTAQIIRFLARELSRDIAVSLMSQYNPVYEASQHPLLSRRLTRSEYSAAVDVLEQEGITKGWTQNPIESPNAFLPDFERSNPF